jgi:hypothetical protein
LAKEKKKGREIPEEYFFLVKKEGEGKGDKREIVPFHFTVFPLSIPCCQSYLASPFNTTRDLGSKMTSKIKQNKHQIFLYNALPSL